MIKCVVITQDRRDARFLSLTLNLPRNHEYVTVYAAGGWSSAGSAATTALVEGRWDVVLVVDANSDGATSAEELEDYHIQMLQRVDTRQRKWLAVAVQPELTGLLFRDRARLEAFIGKPVTDSDFENGQREPKRILKALIGDESLEDFEARLTPEIVSALREEPEIRRVSEFLERQGYTTGAPQVANVA